LTACSTTIAFMNIKNINDTMRCLYFLFSVKMFSLSEKNGNLAILNSYNYESIAKGAKTSVCPN
ncbi:MAG: hypothetical protein ACK45W_07675, partial [Pseudanabaena sp.]